MITVYFPQTDYFLCVYVANIWLDYLCYNRCFAVFPDIHNFHFNLSHILFLNISLPFQLWLSVFPNLSGCYLGSYQIQTSIFFSFSPQHLSFALPSFLLPSCPLPPSLFSSPSSLNITFLFFSTYMLSPYPFFIFKDQTLLNYCSSFLLSVHYQEDQISGTRYC